MVMTTNSSSTLRDALPVALLKTLPQPCRERALYALIAAALLALGLGLYFAPTVTGGFGGAASVVVSIKKLIGR